MNTFLLVVVVFATVILLMAVGVIFGRKPLKGSCGGLSALAEKTGSGPLCEICGEDPRTKTEPCEGALEAEERRADRPREPQRS